MDRPDDTSLPFFTYGLFKPGQLGYFQIQGLVEDSQQAVVEGKLLERDGTPILKEERGGEVQGYLLEFKDEERNQGYESIASVEPEKQYRWVEKTINLDGDSRKANVLIGRNPTRGTTELNTYNWDGSNDPLFTDALDVVKEKIQTDYEFDFRDKKPFFRLQMAYLLLWSSIERYVSLRYGLRGTGGDKSVHQKISKMAEEPGFQKGLQSVYSQDRPRQRVVRADRPQEHEKLDPDNPEDSIVYYYQVRSNLSHRGKSAAVDFDILRHSLEELYTIFNDYVLPSAFENPEQ